ncbi:GFA family protein [Rhodosalinus sediminis]|uniref:GFA family protein n=1 Tax=Rhodosalinus sediminis TaxID=1940533 RepID=A0A3D9BRW4_9RHOB|nr:GFA family protein [Rhodosalinus sediminis]REC56182.1 GFA family protein [Rhodosalinus sediminis]
MRATVGDRTAGCLCGAVRMTLRDMPRDYGACHCEMCRRWTGAAFVAVPVPAERVEVAGSEAIGRLQSSAWAERAWCTRCGAGLWYRVTAPGTAGHGDYEIPIGLLDDPNGLAFRNEIFADCRPDTLTFEGMSGRETLTRAETFAKFAPTEEGQA